MSKAKHQREGLQRLEDKLRQKQPKAKRPPTPAKGT